MKLAKFFLAGALSFLLNANLASAQTFNWQQTNGPLGGTVNAVAINKTNGYIYAAVESAGIFRSTDNGENWAPANAGLSASAVQAIALNANGHVFAGTNLGAFRSLDNGASWTQVYAGTATTRNIQSLTINPQSGEIFAATSFANNGTMLRSSDNGATWTAFTNGLANVGIIQALAVNAATGDVFAGTSVSGVLRSTDHGGTWAVTDSGLTYKNIHALTVTANGDLFIGADSTASNHRIFRSSDNGKNWNLILTPTSSVVSFALNASGHILAGAYGAGVYLSTDNGNNWAPRNTGFRNRAILALALNANDHVFAGTHCTGVFRSTDNAASWAAINTNLRYTNIISLTVHQITGHVFAGSHCGGVFRSSDNGNNWAWVGLPNQAIAALISHPNGTLFAGTQGVDIFLGAGGDIYRSTNDGDIWERVSPDNDYFLSFAVAPNGDIYSGIGYFEFCGLGFCDYGDIFQSGNNGQSWTRVASRLDDHVTALAVGANGRAIAGTPEGIYRRSGDFWNKVNAANARSLVFHPATGYFFAGTSSGILRSIDDGESWSTINSLPGNFTWALTAAANGDIYAATEKSGVLRSADNGATWQQAGAGLASNDVRSLAINNFSGRIFAGASNRGVFLQEGLPAAAVMKPEVAATQTIGAEFFVDVAVSNVQNLFGAGFELNYTNTVYVDALQAEPGVFLGTDLIFLPTIDDANGKVSIGISRKSGQGGVSGSGVLARLKFKSLATAPLGTQVVFALQNVAANDPAGAGIALSTASDTTTISGVLVWPGDTNNDKLVNQTDVLPIGLHWNKTGPARQNRSTNWTEQLAAPWSPAAATYADANGDGVVNQSDVLPIGLNWGKTHTSAGAMDEHRQISAVANGKANSPQILGKQSGAAEICHSITGDTSPGQEFWVDVQVTNVTSLFGLSFELLYSPTAHVDPQSSEPGSFMGSDVIFFPNIDKASGKISVGISQKTPQTGSNGSGVVMRMKMRMASNTPPQTSVTVVLQNVVANDPSGTSMPLTICTTGVKAATPIDEAPAACLLHANSPNPFNPSTTIKYDLAQPVEVKLIIYDMLGRHVRTLVDQRQQAGRYAITWDGRNEQGQSVASGTFIYQLRVADPVKGGTGSFVQTRRMALVR